MPHAEGVEIFVHLLNDGYGLNNVLVLAVDVEADIVSREGVGQTEFGSVEIRLFEVLVFYEFGEVSPYPSEQLEGHVIGHTLDLKAVRDHSCQLVVDHCQLEGGFLLLLGQVRLEEGLEVLGKETVPHGQHVFQGLLRTREGGEGF